ncbi:MAG: SAM-dependent methyltransferase [Rhizomicrobium sp.]|nr:SAM-dependent methyltransferase [Rhizomicrobium sp.]
MNALGQRIAELIAVNGPISVAQFMTLCQFDPQGGSYTARQTIGRDFITAPEISQSFGEMLGLWVAQTWHDQGRPENPRLVELGPGRGTLMADAIRALSAAAPHFLLDAEIVLVEASPALAALQKEKLGRVAADVRWQDRFDDSLSDRPLYVIANEFFDCLPIHQCVKTERGWCERMVGVAEGTLCFVLAPEPLAVPPEKSENAPLGAVFETAPAATAFVQEIARVIAAQGGGALFIDYGYSKTAFGETLQAIADGKFAEILAQPGQSDLSAHVDFGALKGAGEAAGAKAYGPVTQCNFLADLGIGERGERLILANPLQAREIATAIDRLVNPELMGEMFKVLAVAPKTAPQVPGFGLDK